MKELVISVYDRDYSWVSQLDKDVKITPYRKGNGALKEGEILIEPNVGRDVHTFFYHLYNRYDTLAPLTFFSQDYPFDHVSNYVSIINGKLPIRERFAVQSNDGCWFFCTQYGLLKCDVNGAPHHPGLQLDKMWNKVFGTECPTTLEFTPTGHFAITDDKARSLPRSFYKNILNILEQDPNSPWEIERLEPYIFLQ